ncbi:MAG: division/cell wall cluster transcriptional repressor MraZ [Sandaracinobacteroides sp.]
MLSLFHRGWRAANRGFEASPRPALTDPQALPHGGDLVIRAYFSGTYVNGVDAKHRLSVPAPLRETIEQRSATRELVLGPDEHSPCLIGYDISYFERLEARLDDEFAADFGPGRNLKARSIFGATEHLRYDETGRIILSPLMREMGEIGSQVVFMGVGHHFEIWSPDILLQQEGQDPRVQKLVKALVAGKGA